MRSSKPFADVIQNPQRRPLHRERAAVAERALPTSLLVALGRSAGLNATKAKAQNPVRLLLAKISLLMIPG